MAKVPAPKPFSLAIVGGGITGLVLAISLTQQNISITLYESSSKFGEIGAGVGFGPNAVKAMQLISPGIMAGFRRCQTEQFESKRKIWFSVSVGDCRKAGDEDQGFEYAGRTGNKVEDELFEIPYTNIEGTGGVGGVHRARFLDELVSLIPPDIARFRKRLVDVTSAEDGSGDAVLHFADGTTAQHTAVLGCDGIKSQTRKVLLGGDECGPVFTGKCAHRGLIPMTKAIELLGEERANNSQIYFGYHSHILTFPIDRGKTMNVVAFASYKTWNSPHWVVQASHDQRNGDFVNYGPAVKALVAAMELSTIWALFDHPPAPTYYGTRPRVCLVGDAAHASTPHQGAGAGMGIEDCYILGNLIGDAVSAEDLERAFKAYDEIRRPRTQNLVTTSREAGMLWDFELESDDLDAIEKNMRSRMQWIWNIDLEVELQKAKDIFHEDKVPT
ncbi:mannitol 1-phosphate dehydrogenase 2 [Xylariaceae sp. FL0255]|nr:mannitol 1-phosphate dehydrogenase 2 [Xylariaceae sp. FL0255]